MTIFYILYSISYFPFFVLLSIFISCSRLYAYTYILSYYYILPTGLLSSPVFSSSSPTANPSFAPLRLRNSHQSILIHNLPWLFDDRPQIKYFLPVPTSSTTWPLRVLLFFSFFISIFTSCCFLVLSSSSLVALPPSHKLLR